jgi:hypothetical protein
MTAARKPRKLRKPAASKKAARPAGDGVAEMLRAMEAELTAHVGHPTPTEKILIERAVWSRLHLKLLDEKAVNGIPLAAADRAAFIQLSNVLIQALSALGEPASDDKSINFESLSDEELGRLAGIAARRVERVVINPARQIIADKLGRIFRREVVPEDAPVPVAVSPVPVPDVAADPLPAAADAPVDALDEPPVASATLPSRPALRVVVSHPSPDGEYPQEYLDHAQKDAEARAAQKARFHTRF